MPTCTTNNLQIAVQKQAHRLLYDEPWVLNPFSYSTPTANKLDLALIDSIRLSGEGWDDSGINSRAVDLSAIFSFYPSSSQQDFVKIYSKVEPHTWQLALCY